MNGSREAGRGSKKRIPNFFAFSDCRIAWSKRTFAFLFCPIALPCLCWLCPLGHLPALFAPPQKLCFPPLSWLLAVAEKSHCAHKPSIHSAAHPQENSKEAQKHARAPVCVISSFSS